MAFKVRCYCSLLLAPHADGKEEYIVLLVALLEGKVPVEQLMGKLTRSHVGPGGKQSHQCLVCSKWYAVPPIKHMRSHVFAFRYGLECRLCIAIFYGDSMIDDNFLLSIGKRKGK